MTIRENFDAKVSVIEVPKELFEAPENADIMRLKAQFVELNKSKGFSVSRKDGYFYWSLEV